jgi:hypothetical protein
MWVTRLMPSVYSDVSWFIVVTQKIIIIMYEITARWMYCSRPGAKRILLLHMKFMTEHY